MMNTVLFAGPKSCIHALSSFLPAPSASSVKFQVVLRLFVVFRDRSERIAKTLSLLFVLFKDTIMQKETKEMG